MAKKKNNYTPEVESKIKDMRFQIALKLGYLTEPYESNWWDTLDNKKKSEVQGRVTKLLIMKAQTDMVNGKFNF